MFYFDSLKKTVQVSRVSNESQTISSVVVIQVFLFNHKLMVEAGIGRNNFFHTEYRSRNWKPNAFSSSFSWKFHSFTRKKKQTILWFALIKYIHITFAGKFCNISKENLRRCPLHWHAALGKKTTAMNLHVTLGKKAQQKPQFTVWNATNWLCYSPFLHSRGHI